MYKIKNFEQNNFRGGTMKKILISFFVLSLMFLTGCDTMNTPTKRAEEYLSRYNSLDEEVTSDIDLMVETENLNDDNSEIYRNTIERQLKDLKYEIVSEEINGDTATVTAKVTVYDLMKSKEESNAYYSENPTEFYTNDRLDNDKYSKYELENMLEFEDTIDYTIEIDLTRVDDVWTVNEVDNDVKEKIYGLYDYKNDGR